MGKKIFKDGLVYGKLFNVELSQETDADNKRVQVWIFSAMMTEGNLYNPATPPGDDVLVERKFYIPGGAQEAVDFSNAVGWNKRPGIANAKFAKPNVCCRATFKPANKGKNGRDYPAGNDFGELFVAVGDDEINAALAATFGAAAMTDTDPQAAAKAAKEAAAAAKAAREAAAAAAK